MKTLAIDRGNTRLKVGLFEENQLVERRIFEQADQVTEYVQQVAPRHVILASVAGDAESLLRPLEVKGKKLLLSHTMTLPIRLAYRSPETLGVDRIAAVCGAYSLFPDKPCLVIDAGTCMTFDFLDSTGCYQGGSISPGIRMRLIALHTQTARLPLVQAVHQAELIGKTTEEALQSGVMNGMVAEIKGIVAQYQAANAHLQVVLCGGDVHFFENQVKESIFVVPDLVLMGLNRILTQHVAS